MIPEETVDKVDVALMGRGACLLVVKWLSANGYDLSKTYVRCSVASPYSKGVTGRENLVTLLGRVRYNYDSVDWEWQKKE